MKPKLSVIIPVYNAEKTIKKCLDSISFQSFKNYEIIVVDDCSEDNSLDIIKGYKKVTYIKLDKNSGAGRARTVGVNYAKGPIVVFTDSDCIVPNDWLNKIYNNLYNYDVVAVCGGYSESLIKSFIGEFCFYELEDRRKNLSGFVCASPSNNFSCKKDLFLEVGGFPIDSYGAEDLELSFKISKKGKIFWDKTNNISHHFPPTIKKYLKQQYNFAKETIKLYLRKPELFKMETYQGKSNKIIILFSGIFLLTLVLSIFWVKFLYISLLSLIIVTLMDFNFLSLFFRKKGFIYMIRAIPLLYMRDFSWVYGMIIGLFKK